jgi:signal transduction histidine kinase
LPAALGRGQRDRNRLGDCERIFRPFERLHSQHTYSGHGLGLAIVQRAVERVGGSVGVESIPGKGSKFWIELPSDIPTAR